MTPEEFATARRTLGLSIEDLAAELNAPPHSVVAMEQGTIRVPKRIAADLAWRAAVRQREAMLEASGLPECATEAALSRSAVAQATSGGDAGFKELAEHTAGCPVCKARSDYLAQHAPPMPEFPMPAWMRAMGWIIQKLERTPRVLHPPEGDAGDGRRAALFAAVGFSLLAIGIALLAAISRAISHRDPGWWREPLSIAVLVPIGYFVGFFLAGWVFDATRRIRHRIAGYVVRGAFGAAAVYGSIGLILPAMDRTTTLREWPMMVGLFAVFGAVGGGVLWIVHWMRGKLPSRVS